MTREEILYEINYQGKYTKEVKKRLNKLIKKYHPDNNKKDQKTILILYEIKKELENNTLEYSVNVKEKDYVVTKEAKHYLFFLENMIEKLKRERNKINNEINSLYKKLNKLIRTKNEKQNDLYTSEYDMLNLNNDMEELIRIDLIDKIFIVFMISLCIVLFIFRNLFILIFIIILLLSEMYYIYIRYSSYKEKEKVLKKLKKEYKDKINEYKNIENDVEELEKEELKLKRKRTKINNTIQFYNRQISMVKENGNINEEEEVYNRGKN